MHATRRSRQYPWVVSLASVDLLRRERELLARGEVVAGVDEVGRGALRVTTSIASCSASAVTSVVPAPRSRSLATSKRFSGTMMASRGIDAC